MIPPLAGLGGRILVCGPAGSGKSSLAAAIGRALDLPVIHLDRLRFVAGSDWVERPDADFAADIAAAAEGERWLIDGNYFRWMAPRLSRATGIVSLQAPRLGNYLRYLKRCLLNSEREGGVAGAPERINWKMTRWILWDEPKRRGPKRALLHGAGLPLVEVHGMRQLNRLYRAWALDH